MLRVILRGKVPGANMLKQIDTVIYLLAGMVMVFTVLLFVSAKFLTNDGQTFQVISGLLTGFAGALLARVKPHDVKDDPAKDNAAVVPK